MFSNSYVVHNDIYGASSERNTIDAEDVLLYDNEGKTNVDTYISKLHVTILELQQQVKDLHNQMEIMSANLNELLDERDKSAIMKDVNTLQES
jgi:flagellar biosynthesis chaperone FliJ